MAKKEETHLSMLVETKDKLREIATAQRRTMRAVLVKLVEDEYKKVFG